MLLGIFSLDGLLTSLPVMAKGMFGIFCVTGVSVLTMLILEKATSKEAEKEKSEE